MEKKKICEIYLNTLVEKPSMLSFLFLQLFILATSTGGEVEQLRKQF